MHYYSASTVGTPDAQLISNNIVDCEKIMVMRYVLLHILVLFTFGTWDMLI
jgi:hypothetical protein